MIRPVPNSSARPAGPQTTPLTALLICVIHSSMVNFPLLHKTKKQTEPTKGSVCKIQAHSFSAAGHAAFPAVPLCVSDDGSVLLPERYSRLSLRPYTFGTRCCGLLQSAGQCFPARLSSSFSVHSCARQKDYTIFCPHVQALFFHLMPHAPPECKAERPEPACRVGAFSADVRGFQLPPYCLRQQGPTLGSSAGETPAPQAKNTPPPPAAGG